MDDKLHQKDPISPEKDIYSDAEQVYAGASDNERWRLIDTVVGLGALAYSGLLDKLDTLRKK